MTETTTKLSTGSNTRRDRKYKAFWGVFLFTAVALFFGKLSGGEFVSLASLVFGLYMGGNVGEHWTRNK